MLYRERFSFRVQHYNNYIRIVQLLSHQKKIRDDDVGVSEICSSCLYLKFGEIDIQMDARISLTAVI